MWAHNTEIIWYEETGDSPHWWTKDKQHLCKQWEIATHLRFQSRTFQDIYVLGKYFIIMSNDNALLNKCKYNHDNVTGWTSAPTYNGSRQKIERQYS